MNYLKYTPYVFLVVALVFSYMAVQRYGEGEDGFPHLILAVAAVGYFFVKRYIYNQRRKQQP